MMFARLLVGFVNRTGGPGALRAAAVAGLVVMASGAARAGEAGPRPGPPSAGNAVTHWNTVATDAFTPSQGTNPMAQSRTLAILHAAMHDALNAIDGRFEPYRQGLMKTPSAPRVCAIWRMSVRRVPIGRSGPPPARPLTRTAVLSGSPC